MRKRYKKKSRSCCGLCKPHKLKMANRWKHREFVLLKEFERYGQEQH